MAITAKDIRPRYLSLCASQFEAARHRNQTDLLELNGTDLRREPIEVREATLASIPSDELPWRSPERTPGASRGECCVSSRLQAGCRGDRLEAPGIALPVGPVARLAEVQEPGGACGEAGG